jgi:hypothetical protein
MKVLILQQQGLAHCKMNVKATNVGESNAIEVSLNF